MSVESDDTTDDCFPDDHFVEQLIMVLRGLDKSAEPWKLRPPENPSDPAKLLVGAWPGLVRGRLEGSGYEVRNLVSVYPWHAKNLFQSRAGFSESCDPIQYPG